MSDEHCHTLEFYLVIVYHFGGWQGTVEPRVFYPRYFPEKETRYSPG